MSAPENVSVDLMLVLEIMDTLRLAHVWALKDSQPEELAKYAPDFKPWKWDGYELDYVKRAHDQHYRLMEQVRPQVPGGDS